MINKYSIFENRDCISYDFDGVLHLSMIPNTTHPSNWLDWNIWIPSLKMHEKLKQDHKENNKIVVISARNKYMFKVGNNLIGIDPKNKFDYIKYLHRLKKDYIEYDMTEIIRKFIIKYQLPVDEIILTNDAPKIFDLRILKVIKHYDDNIEMIEELKNTNITFVYVRDDKIIDTFNSERPHNKGAVKK